MGSWADEEEVRYGLVKDQKDIASQSISEVKRTRKWWGSELFSKSTLGNMNTLFSSGKKIFVDCDSSLADVDSVACTCHIDIYCYLRHDGQSEIPFSDQQWWHGRTGAHKLFWSVSYRTHDMPLNTSQSRRWIYMGGLIRSRCLLLVSMTMWHQKKLFTCCQMLRNLSYTPVVCFVPY